MKGEETEPKATKAPNKHQQKHKTPQKTTQNTNPEPSKHRNTSTFLCLFSPQKKQPTDFVQKTFKTAHRQNQSSQAKRQAKASSWNAATSSTAKSHPPTFWTSSSLEPWSGAWSGRFGAVVFWSFSKADAGWRTGRQILRYFWGDWTWFCTVCLSMIIMSDRYIYVYKKIHVHIITGKLPNN